MMRRSFRKRKRCPFCDGQGVWWPDADYDTSVDERPCDECQQRGWIPRKTWRRRRRRKRAMSRAIYRWLVRMGRARGLDSMPLLVQPYTPSNIEIGGGFCWHPKARLWKTFGRVSHRSMLANWVKCTVCDGSGKLDELFGMCQGDPCGECGESGRTAGLLLLLRARHGGDA